MKIACGHKVVWLACGACQRCLWCCTCEPYATIVRVGRDGGVLLSRENTST